MAVGFAALAETAQPSKGRQLKQPMNMLAEVNINSHPYVNEKMCDNENSFSFLRFDRWFCVIELPGFPPPNRRRQPGLTEVKGHLQYDLSLANVLGRIAQLVRARR